MKTSRISMLLAACAMALFFGVAAGSVDAQIVYMYVNYNGPGDGDVKMLDNPNLICGIYCEGQGYDEYIETMNFYIDYDDSADWDRFVIWADDGDGRFDQNNDYYITEDYWANFYVNYYVANGQQFWVTIDVSANARAGDHVQLYTYSYNTYWYETYWGYYGGGCKFPWGEPGYGPYMTFQPSNSNMALTAGAQLGAGNVTRGAVRQPILQFGLVSDGSGQDPYLTTIQISGNTGASPAHSVLSSDVTSVKLYREIGSPDGFLSAAEQSLSGYPVTGQYIGGTFGYQFYCNEYITTTTMNFLVVVDISGTANNLNKIFRASVAQGGIYISTGSPSWFAGVGSFTEDAQTIKDPLATYLSMNVQPANTQAGIAMNSVAPFTTGVRVYARKPDNSVDATFGSPMAVVIESGPGVFTPSSTLGAQAQNGEAFFTNLRITKTGTYTLRFTSPPLAPIVTTSFLITPLIASKLVVTKNPTDGVVGIALPPPPVVEAWDTYNNLDYNFNKLITATLQANPGGSALLNPSATASSGTATFSNLLMDKDAIGYTMVFSTAGLPATAASPKFNIIVGAADHLVILQEPAGASGGVAIPIKPKLQVQDWGNNEIIAYIGNMAAAIGVNPVGGTLSGTTSVAVVGSYATFDNISINTAGTGYTLMFSIEAGTISIQSQPFDVLIGTPVKLAITQQPGNSTGGLVLGASSILAVQDAGDNVVTNDNFSKTTASITPLSGAPGAVLSGTLEVQASGGVVTFADLSIDIATATPYTLTFTSDSGYASAISASVVISVGIPAKLGIATQPGMATYGAPFVQQPVVRVQDAGGNLVTTATPMVSVALDAASGIAGATLQGNASVAAVAGVATFATLAIDFPGAGFKLIFTSGSLQLVISAPFNVASTADRLGVSVQPTLSAAASPLLTQPSVEVRDNLETLISVDFYTQVTAEILPDTGTPGAALTGTVTMTVTNGIAAFTNLRISMPGVGYRLRFTCFPLLTPVISDAFDVSGTAVMLVLTRQPGNCPAGEPFFNQPRVEVRDANEVRCVTDNTTIVNAYITPATGTDHAILMGTNPITVVNGVAAFTDLAIDRPGSSYTLSFSAAPSLFAAQSDSFEILGEVIPPPMSDTEVVAGLDGGTCSGQTNAAAPWLLLAVVMLLGAVAVRRRAVR